jgi:hypothetical protein
MRGIETNYAEVGWWKTIEGSWMSEMNAPCFIARIVNRDFA